MRPSLHWKNMENLIFPRKGGGIFEKLLDFTEKFYIILLAIIVIVTVIGNMVPEFKISYNKKQADLICEQYENIENMPTEEIMEKAISDLNTISNNLKIFLGVQIFAAVVSVIASIILFIPKTMKDMIEENAARRSDDESLKIIGLARIVGVISFFYTIKGIFSDYIVWRDFMNEVANIFTIMDGISNSLTF